MKRLFIITALMATATIGLTEYAAADPTEAEVQAKMREIDKHLNGPQREYEATMEAIRRMPTRPTPQPSTVSAIPLTKSAVPSPDDRFDLICTGKLEATNGGGEENYATKLTVDLSRGIICQNTCTTVEPLTVEPSWLHLTRSDEQWTVHRPTGDFHRRGEGYFVTGHCRKAPYTAIPANRF